MTEDCPLCGNYHDYRICKDFLKSKNRTSLSPYYAKQPRLEEERGFLAAGVLPSDTLGNIFLIQERRNGCYKYNFIGGKRETFLDQLCQSRLEDAFSTAKRELWEETRNLTSKYRGVYWFPESKYLLFVVDKPDSTGITRSFSRSQVIEGVKTKLFHSYMIPLLWKIVETQ